MYIETSGDATFTVLIEGMQATSHWAKVGVMFRSQLTSTSSHYSIFQTKSQGISQQYRHCTSCNTTHYGTYQQYSSVWLRVVKDGNVLKAFYKPSYLLQTDPWYQFGYQLSMNDIPANGYFVGVAVSSGITSMATSYVSNIQLTRTCSSKSITLQQCDQASNCESGSVTGSCYKNGEVPSWESLGPVSSVFDTGSDVTVFGCNDAVTKNNALDMTTNKFVCERTDVNNLPTGLIIKPSHKRLSIAEGLRVYANSDCSNCDPVCCWFSIHLIIYAIICVKPFTHSPPAGDLQVGRSFE